MNTITRFLNENDKGNLELFFRRYDFDKSSSLLLDEDFITEGLKTGDYVVGCFVDGNIIGICTLGGADYEEFDELKSVGLPGFLSDLYVLSNYRNNGYARLLIKAALAYQNEWDVISAQLLDFSLKPFFESFGFEQNGDSNIFVKKVEFEEQIQLLAELFGCKVSFEQRVYSDKQNSLWYGGEVITLHKEGFKFHIDANGDVRGWLWRCKEGESPTQVFYIKDKHRGGDFGKEMSTYIDNDKELYKLCDTDGELKKGAYTYTLELDNNNWWEVFVTTPDGKWHDLMYALESGEIKDAVIEMLDCIPELKKYLEQEGE